MKLNWDSNDNWSCLKNIKQKNGQDYIQSYGSEKQNIGEINFDTL